MFDAAVEGRLKAMYMFGEDIAQTDPEHRARHRGARVARVPRLQDIFMSETAKFAHVVLPGSTFLEKNGTFTNAERRIQLVARRGQAARRCATDVDIITTVSRRSATTWATRRRPTSWTRSPS